jgi:hypothetical protein
MRRVGDGPLRVVKAAILVMSARPISKMNFHTYDSVSTGRHDHAPREDEDFVYELGQVLPGAHPLPLVTVDNSLTNPLVSPYMPSPHRVHPYWTTPPEEFPHFKASVPIVFPFGSIKENIVVPVHSIRDGSISHTRQLDPYVFGRYPHPTLMSVNATYWAVRCQNFSSMWDYETREIWRKAQKNWPNTGMGMSRQSNRKNHHFPWGGRSRPAKPWNMLMPSMNILTWHKSNRMALTLKMLQGKLMVVDRLTLPEPTREAFLDLSMRMGWDVRHKGGGVLFMDGGSRLTQSMEFDRNFFFGSFFNGRVKLVRPTILMEEQYDYNRTAANANFKGPKGPKNPIPINRFNCCDALEHHLLVISEGAIIQLEQEMLPHKIAMLPPHIRRQLPDMGMFDSPVLGDCAMPLDTIEMEAAGRMEEREAGMYEPHYDNPYKPWADERQASYSVDAVDGVISRHVEGKKTSWTMLQ